MCELEKKMVKKYESLLLGVIWRLKGYSNIKWKNWKGTVNWGQFLEMEIIRIIRVLVVCKNRKFFTANLVNSLGIKIKLMEIIWNLIIWE